jgi:hypothetical protein
MTSLRIFISSPGDVAREREIAGRVIKRLQAQFHARARLEPYFWEYEPMLAGKDYQANIPSTADFDIVICILWSRLGSRLHSSYRKPDGGVFESGTEYELETAREAHLARGTPDLLVYRNKSQPIIPQRPKEVRDEGNRQYDMLEAFVNRWFKDNREGVWRAASNSYRDLGEFEEKLERHLEKLIERRLPESEQLDRFGFESTWTKGSPFRGLQTFDFEDAPIFFGRTKAIDDVLTALRKQWVNHNSAFVLVLGDSGTGKSSLVRAGVLPLLVQPGAMEGVALWRRAVMRPADAGGDLFAALAGALVHESALPELLSSGKTEAELAAQLREKPDTVETRLEETLSHAADLRRMQEYHELTQQGRSFQEEGRVTDADQVHQRMENLKPPVTRLVLVVDQFEEIFTLGGADEQRQSFVRTLRELVVGGHVAVIATLRSDFYPRYQQIPELVELTRGDGKYDLEKPTAEELGQMIRLPAITAGLRFEKDSRTQQGLDEDLRDAAIQDASILPLLEFMLDELYRRRAGQVLTFEAYEALGRMEGALANRAEEEFQKLPAEAQASFDTVMRAVVTNSIDDRQTPTKRWALRDELTSTQGAATFVEAFIAARLFQTDQDKEGRPAVTVCHEALLVHWKRLQEWVQENRENLILRDRVRESAREWEENAGPKTLWAALFSDENYLLKGTRLTEVKRLLVKRPEFFTGREAIYVKASLRQDTVDKTVTTGSVSFSTLLVFFLMVKLLSGSLSKTFSYHGWHILVQSPVVIQAPAPAHASTPLSEVLHPRNPVFADKLYSTNWLPFAGKLATGQSSTNPLAGEWECLEEGTYTDPAQPDVHHPVVEILAFWPDGNYDKHEQAKQSDGSFTHYGPNEGERWEGDHEFESGRMSFDGQHLVLQPPQNPSRSYTVTWHDQKLVLVDDSIPQASAKEYQKTSLMDDAPLPKKSLLIFRQSNTNPR